MSETLTPDKLIAGDYPIVTKSVTIGTDADIERGAVLGKITVGAVPAAGTPGVSNTGDGTMTGVTGGSSTKVGVYKMTCVAIDSDTTTITVPSTGVVAGTGNGTCTGVADGGNALEGDYVATCIDATVSGSEIFQVVDPNGNMLENATVDVAYTSDQINFTINDGSTDFIVGDTVTITTTASTVDSDSGRFEVIDPDGNRLPDANADVAYTNAGLNFTINDGATDFEVSDSFTVTVPEGSGKYIITDSSAIDGSQNPVAILLEDAAAASADVENAPIALSGEFNEDEVSFGDGVYGTRVEALRASNIYLKSTLDK